MDDYVGSEMTPQFALENSPTESPCVTAIRHGCQRSARQPNSCRS